MPHVTLVTCDPLPEPDPDAAPLEAALDEAGLSWRWAAWDDADVDWSASPMTVLRSTWDYYRDHAAFLGWVDGVSTETMLLNPASVVRYNGHKRYLLELAEHGLAVIPTAMVRAGGGDSLVELCAERGWEKVVVKPAVSAGSWNTHVFRSTADGSSVFDGLVAERDVLVQPFMDRVESHGERSLVAIDGELSHAVLKHPRFAGERERVEGPMPIDASERELAEAAMAEASRVAGGPLLYTRVDLIRGASGEPMIAELELIEPSLFFGMEPASAARFVAGLRRRMS